MGRIFDFSRCIWGYIDPVAGFASLAFILLGKIKAPAKFGDVIQGADAKYNGKLSWLQVEVSIKTPFPWEERVIPRCEAKIYFYDEHDRLVGEYDLRWRFRDSTNGRARVMLEYGHTEIIPIVARYTGADLEQIAVYGKCVGRLTDESFLVHKRDFHDLAQGKYRFKIKLFSGTRTWESQAYVLNVPPSSADNGHFRIEPEKRIG